MQFVLDNEIINGGEYQINDGIIGMMSKGKIFKTGEVDQWMDCGNKKVTIQTNQQVLINEQKKGVNTVHDSVKLNNSIIVPPCFIGENVILTNSVIGPHVSLGKDSTIENAVISNSIIQHDVQLNNVVIKDSMIGSKSNYQGLARVLSLGDYSDLNE